MLALIHLELNLLDDSCRIAGYNGHRRHILCHDRVGTDYAAVAELSATNMIVSELSFSMDFDELTEMCRFFRRIEGVSPGQWREKT